MAYRSRRSHPCCPRFFGCLVLIVLVTGSLLAAGAQVANTNYTADMPSVERVKAEIKGSDPTDTLARQVAVFVYLSQYIQRIKYNRTVRGPYTPDEARLMAAYDLAAYELSQAYAKSHTPDETKAFERLHGIYEMDGAFRKDWSARLIGKQGTAAIQSSNAELAARYQAHVAQQQREYEQAHAQQQAADQAAQQAANGQPAMRNDKGSVAARRCLELGGSELECVGKGMWTGLVDMTGIDLGAISGAAPSGLVMGGLYQSPTVKIGFTSIGISGDTGADLDGCGKLVGDVHPYTLTKKGSDILINIQSEPKPFVLLLGKDGRLVGPGPTDVTGKVIVGYHNTWVEKRYTADNSIVPGSGHWEQTPIYAPKTERCTIGVLAPAPPTAPLQGVLSILNSFAPGDAGLRMTGPYAGQSGLGLEFDLKSVVLDCGAAHVRQSYSVENTPTQVLITIKNGSSPFTLALGPNGSLSGSGSTDVNGRLVNGTNSESVTYAAKNARCAIGTLTPKGTALATAGVSAGPVPSAVNSGSVAATSPPVAGNAGLSVAASVPLNGGMVFLMKESFDVALRNAGAPIPAGMSPGKAWLGWAINCRPPADCRTLNAGMSPYFVDKVALANDGKATFPKNVPAGSYYVMGSAQVDKHIIFWDLKVEMKPGANSVRLDQQNAETVN